MLAACSRSCSTTGWVNAALSFGNTLAVALPTFVTGLVLILLFAVRAARCCRPAARRPTGSSPGRTSRCSTSCCRRSAWRSVPAAALTRFLTEALRTELRQPYVTTARALGISRRRIVLTQALRNALPSTVTVLGIQFGTLLGGAVLVEAIFAWPGLGGLIEEAISGRDYPLVQVLLLLSVAVFVVIQLLTDVIHAWLDPRIRIGGDGMSESLIDVAAPEAASPDDQFDQRRRPGIWAALRRGKGPGRADPGRRRRRARAAGAAARAAQPDRADPRRQPGRPVGRALARHRRGQPRHLLAHALRHPDRPDRGLPRGADRRARSASWSG